jgi:hypothetical protein
MKNSLQSANRKAGNAGEAIAAMELSRRGVEFVEPIRTGWGIVRGKGGRIVDAFPIEKVSGDLIGIIPHTGQFVRAEVKTTDGRLPYSQLEPHQHAALQRHHELGGLSLLVWVHDGVVSVMRYPVAGFAPRKSIRAEDVVEWC